MGILGTYHRLPSAVGLDMSTPAGSKLVSALQLFSLDLFSSGSSTCNLECGLICITENVLICKG